MGVCTPEDRERRIQISTFARIEVSRRSRRRGSVKFVGVEERELLIEVTDS